MKNSFKKFVSVMLTIAMLMSFMTFNASAEATGNLTVESVTADESTVAITFDRELNNITENDVKSNVKLFKKMTEEVSYSAEVNGDTVIITPADGVEADKLYTLNISADFGYQDVTLAEAFTKMFKLEKIWATDFNDTSKAPTDYFDKITNYRWNSKTELGGTNKYESVHSKTVIQGGKMYAQYLNAPAFWILDEAVMNAEDYTLTFDMARYNHQQNFSANWGVILNADVTKEPGEWDSIIYGSKNYTGFGWQNDVLRDNIQTMYVHPNKYAGTFGAEKIPFVSDNGATSAVTFNADGSVTLPEQRVQADAYKIVKKGKVMTLYINGALVNTYDTTADAASIYGSTEAPSKGGIILGSTAYDHAAIVNGAMEFGDITVTRYTEVEGIEELSVVSANANESKAEITFNEELIGVTEEQVKESIQLLNSEFAPVKYSASVNGATITLVPEKAFEINNVYTIKVMAGFGFNEYMTLTDSAKMFKIQTIWKTDFANSDKTVADYFIASNYRWNSGYESVHSKKVIQDGKLYMQNINAATLWLFDVVKNEENFTLTFDLANYDMNGFFVLFNVERDMPGEWDTCVPTAKHKGVGLRVDAANAKVYTSYPSAAYPYYTGAEVATIPAPAGSDATVTFNEDGTVTESKAVTPDSYKFVKNGNIISLYINDAFVYKYDTSADAATLYGTETPATKGGIALASNSYSTINEDGAFVFGDISIVKYTEIEGIEELNVQAIDGDENSVKIIFDRELAGVSATDAGEAIKLIDSELKEIECEISIDGSVVTLTPDKSFEIDTVYGVKVGAGFGFNEYMTLDEYVQMFMIETVWKTSFATNSDVSSYFSTGNYRWTTGYDNTKSKFVVSNGKFYMQNVSTPAIWIMNDTVKNIENYVMTFDMAYYNHNNKSNIIDFGMLFNVDWSSETALGQWHYMQTSGTHSGFGWQYKIGQQQFVNIHKKTTASTVTTGTISNYMDLSTKGADATLTFAEDGSVTPNTKVQADSYKIVKKGNVITLYVNDALIGTYDSTEDAKALYGENNVPTKGGIVLGMVQTDAKKIWENGGLEFGNIKISTFKTVDSFVAVPELLAEYNTGKINGTVKFVNYSGAVISNAKMIVAAYKNDELVGLTSYSLTNVSNESIKEVPYEITGLTEKPDEVRAFAWKDFETIKPLCSAKVESVN